MQANDYLWITTLNKAIKRNKREAFSRYFQLATTNTHGAAKVRTVVYRGMDEDGQSPLIITDSRSAKVSQLENNRSVELCWYFTVTREQFRITGEATLYTHLSLEHQRRERVWQQLSPPAQAQFFWPAPGADHCEPPASQSLRGTSAAADDSLDRQMPDNFYVISVFPTAIDHLLLSHPQRRVISTRGSGEWQSRIVNP